MQTLKYSQFALILISLSLISMTPTIHAQVYKWTDENGKVHYSDKSIDEKSQKIQMKREPTSTEIYKAKKRANSIITHQRKVQEIADDEAVDRKLIADKTDADEKKRLAFCKMANRQVRGLGRGSVTYTENDDGSRKYLSDKDKNEMIADYKTEMQKRCH